MKRTKEQEKELIKKFFFLSHMEIEDKNDRFRITMLDLHMLDGFDDDKYDEVEDLANKYIN